MSNPAESHGEPQSQSQGKTRPRISEGAFGWLPSPRDLNEFTKNANPTHTRPVSADSIPLPSDDLSQQVLEYARSKLPTPTFNHSLRVYLYGHAILSQHFPFLFSAPGLLHAFFLTCVLHDIGTAEEFFKTTRMSFDFYGALVALRELEALGCEKEEREAVVEAIIRHQDLGSSGWITSLGAVVQVATVFDNVGLFPQLVHKDTIASVCEKYPRMKWSGCFASTVREEIEAKPWAHSTHIESFAEKVEGNVLMAPFE